MINFEKWLKTLKYCALTSKLIDKSFEYIIGIFAFLFPLLPTYILGRLVARSRYAYAFIPLNLAVSFGIFYITSLFYKVSSLTFLFYGLIPYAVIFVPLMMYVMVYRRKNSFSTGRWDVKQALMHHKAIYISSILFYIFSLFFVESYSFKLPDSLSNYIFYIFTGALTLYYLVIGFGIAGVGMEIKKEGKRKDGLADLD